ncbi:hypothetical protein JCM12294_37900 [Desulfocicer niacini]
MGSAAIHFKKSHVQQEQRDLFCNWILTYFLMKRSNSNFILHPSHHGEDNTTPGQMAAQAASEL